MTTVNADRSHTDAPSGAASADVLLRIRNLSMRFQLSSGFLGLTGRTSFHAVREVNLSIRRGETLGLVGESGCGKTTLGRCVLRAYKPTHGELAYRREDGTVVDLARLGRGELRPYRREIRTVFQDPNSSLNPRMTLLQIVGEPLLVNDLARGAELRDRVAEVLRLVGLRPEYMRRYPHAFSGGERQRIGIARALVTRPRLVVADEAVSALDVSVRSQILNLLEDLQEQLGLTYLFVSHDLSVIRHLCDRVAVMYLGRIVEEGATDDLFTRPRHPYTESLLRALPLPDPRLRSTKKRVPLRGEVPDPASPPPGCTFHPRCPYAQGRCATDEPALIPLGRSAAARCHYADSLQLAGVTDS
ncbi:ABC transporter ATP-binding protein [Actinopolymorpha alba]|uniref:ABC transporter ATP-binding protein n=1 Tax=Actinopolymorpha alba TaxID=533267 RepID=UPI00035C6BA1|nr:oligopeptide/dipeptide ABC transporter ATP-binding protein [Actinopolymorpha alba]